MRGTGGLGLNIIVTTPRQLMAEAAQEAEDCKRWGGGRYFRCLGPSGAGCNVGPGDKMFYVEDGFIRGYAVVDQVFFAKEMRCDTSDRRFGPGWYVFADATTWKWIVPIQFRGFQGWRYFPEHLKPLVKVVGGWLDPKPGGLS